MTAEGAHPRDISKENVVGLTILDVANEGGRRVEENFHSLHIWRRNMVILYWIVKFMKYINLHISSLVLGLTYQYLSLAFILFFLNTLGQCCLAELSVIMQTFYSLSIMVDTSHRWPLNTWNTDWSAAELCFKFYLLLIYILKSHMWLVSTVMGSAAPGKFTAFYSFLYLRSLWSFWPGYLTLCLELERRREAFTSIVYLNDMSLMEGDNGM